MSRPNRSDSDSSDPGAAQFLHSLSPRQLQHLKFAVPTKNEPERFSLFLEEPRETPVPKRFTFDALDAATRKVGKESGKEKLEGRKSEGRARSGIRSSTPSVDLLKEVEKVGSVVSVVDWRFYSTGVSICLLNVVVAWDATSLPIVLPTIATALGGSALESFWLGISFLVAATVFVPLFATLSDIFGRKAILLTALTFFTVGSFIAAVSGNFTGLHLGRSVQGIGAGGICILSNLIVSDLVSVVDRRKWTAILGATWATGAVTGPVIGNAVAEQSQWRWIFWLNLPFCVIAFLILPFFAQLRPASPGAILPKLRSVDWVGFLLLTGSLVSLLLGLTWGGTLHAWSSFHTILPVQFGLIGFLLLLIWSCFLPSPSIIGLGGFLDPTSLATYFGAMIQGIIVFAALYFLPLYFSIVKPSPSPTGAGIRLLPWTLSLAIFALVAFIIISKTRFLRPVVWMGWFLVTLSVALMTLFKQNSTPATWVCIAIVSGAGVGTLYPSLHMSSQTPLSTANPNAHSDDEEGDRYHTKAIANFTFFQFLGQTLGLAISVAVFQNQFLVSLHTDPVFEHFAWLYVKDVVALVVRVSATPEGPVKTQMMDMYVDSLRVVWIVMAALAGAALVVSCFMKEKEVERNREVELTTLDEGYVV